MSGSQHLRSLNLGELYEFEDSFLGL